MGRTLDVERWFTDPNDQSVQLPPFRSVVRVARDYPGRWGARYRVVGIGTSKTYGVVVDVVDTGTDARRSVPVKAVHVDRKATAAENEKGK